jgi:DNA-binding protein H-NS
MSSLFSSLISPINSERELKRQALEAELAVIQREDELEKSARRSTVIEMLRAAMVSEGLKKSDLFPKKESADTVKGGMKYRDPISGKEWSGRGNSPKWIKGKNKEDFLIPILPSDSVHSEIEPSPELANSDLELGEHTVQASIENLDIANAVPEHAAEGEPTLAVTSPVVAELTHSIPASPLAVIPDAITELGIASAGTNVNQVAQAA